MSQATVPERKDLDPAYRWRLEHLFEGTAAWEQELRRVEQLIETVASRSGKLAESPASLGQTLSASSELGEGLDRVYLWAHLRKDQDTRDSDAQALSERASRLATRVAEATAYIEPEIVAIPEDRLREFLRHNELALFRHYLQNLLRMKAHTLSQREEEILAMASEVTRVPRTAFGMLNDADLTFKAVRNEEGVEVELTKGRYSTFMESPVRRVRQDAWNSLTDGYESHKNTLATLLSGAVKRDVFYARVRGYPSSLHAALDGPNIPLEVFHTLIDTLHERRSIVHRYTEFRKRALQVEKLHVHDLYVPLGTSKPPKYPYEQARDILIEGLTPLGEEYVDSMRAGLHNGWVDVFESRAKRSGAYSWGAYGTHPYVLMNYHGTLDHLFTLAHEMGHAMHHHFTGQCQPYVYSHYPIFLAEVASTTNEAVLMDHLLGSTENPDHRTALLNQYLDQIRGTVVTQIMFAEFEHRLHERVENGEALTASSISDIYREIFTDILGPELEFGEREALGWARIPHFYSAYYVYQYATGYSAAIALSRRILQGAERERTDYLNFLKAGDSDYPVDILKSAGVDLTTPAPLNDTLDLFETLLDELEEHISKFGTATAPSG